MIPLAVCSVVMVWLIVDGVLRTKPDRLVPPLEIEKLRNAFRAGDYVGAYQGAQEIPCAINSVVRAGLISLGDGKDATEEFMMLHEANVVSKYAAYTIIGKLKGYKPKAKL